MSDHCILQEPLAIRPFQTAQTQRGAAEGLGRGDCAAITSWIAMNYATVGLCSFATGAWHGPCNNSGRKAKKTH